MKYAIVDYRLTNEEESNLQKLNCSIIKTEPCNLVYEEICGHPDIQLHILEDKTAILHKDASLTFESQLKNAGLNIIRSKNSLTNTYPNDIILNAVSTNNFFIHNLKHTDDMLLKICKNKTPLDVNQGYTKCSTVILNDSAFITSDKSIHDALTKKNADVLFLPPGNISLPGLNYGFIGGTCGMLNKNTLVFYGNLDFYPYKNSIINFLNKYNINCIYLSQTPLIDRGSIFFI